MNPNPFLGVLLHALGGFAAGSFYIPYKNVRGWTWEVYWLVGGVASWIVVPWIVGLLTCPDLLRVLRSGTGKTILWTYLFGVLWGIGGLTFGLSMRYLGLSLGMALSLGFCAVFGTLMPPVFEGRIAGLVASTSGQVVILGILVCLIGIAMCGVAGMKKEKQLSDAEKKASIAEFNFTKGAWVAAFSGVMSSCMAFAFAAGKPIAEAAVEAGAKPIFQNFPVMIVALLGGFTTNFIWCAALSFKNRSWRDYRRVREAGRGAAGVGAAVASRQLRLGRTGRDDLVFPVLLLRHGHDPDGQVRLLELDDPHGLHHHLQQPVGDLLPRVEGDREADAPAGRGRDRRPHPVDGRGRGGQLPRHAQVGRDEDVLHETRGALDLLLSL